jgi:hypothetical protein
MKKISPIAFFLLISIFFRLYKGSELFMYSHDQDLSSWFVKDVTVNHHLRLVGQETSTQGIFIGPYFYYYLIPFFLISHMDPIAGIYAVAIIGVFTTFSFYFIFTKIFGKNIGLLASFLHATSFFLSINEREVVPLEPVILLWTLWFFYATHKIAEGNQKYFILLGLLIGLIWSINMSLILLLPLVLLSFIISKKKLNLKFLLLGLITFAILSLPLGLFEFRHDFQQSKALINSLTTNQKDIVSGVDKIARVFHLMAKNVTNFLVGSLTSFRYWHYFTFVVLAFLYLIYKKRISKKDTIIFIVWFGLIFGFFSFYSKIISEYYLNGLQIIWFTVSTLLVGDLLESKNFKLLGFIILILLSSFNVLRFINYPANQSGFVQRKQIVHYINEDRKARGYPCIAISYIVNPGYDLGYRYLFWREDLHVNHPDSGSPVYTIVFPLAKVDSFDKSFGALGLILPDYNKYNKDDVNYSCSGQNSNLTDPLFGFPPSNP